MEESKRKRGQLAFKQGWVGEGEEQRPWGLEVTFNVTLVLSITDGERPHSTKLSLTQ